MAVAAVSRYMYGKALQYASAELQADRVMAAVSQDGGALERGPERGPAPEPEPASSVRKKVVGALQVLQSSESCCFLMRLWRMPTSCFHSFIIDGRGEPLSGQPLRKLRTLEPKALRFWAVQEASPAKKKKS